MRSTTAALLIGVTVTVGGCHLHDPAAELRSKEAVALFDEIRVDSVTAQALERHRAQTQLAETIAAQLSTRAQTPRLNGLAATKWSDIATEMQASLDRIAPQSDTARGALERARARHVEALRAARAAQGSSVGYAEELRLAAEDGARFVATQKLLAFALIGVARGEHPSRANYESLGAESIAWTRWSPTEQGLAMVEESATVRSLLNLPTLEAPQSLADAKAILDAFADSSGGVRPAFGSLDLSAQDPGLVTTLLSLGFDLARAEERRLGALLAAGVAEASRWELLVASLEQHERVLRALVEDLSALGEADLRVTGEETVSDTLRRLQDDRSHPQNAERIAVIYGVAYDIIAAQRDADGIESIRTRIEELAAEQALINARSRFEQGEALIGRGLEGLAAWSREGLTQTDIAAILGGVGTIAAVVARGN